MFTYDREKMHSFLEAIFRVQKTNFERDLLDQFQSITSDISKKRNAVGNAGTDLIEFLNAGRAELLKAVQKFIELLKGRLAETDINKQYFWISVDEYLTPKISELTTFVGTVIKSKREFQSNNFILAHQKRWPPITSEIMSDWKKRIKLEKETSSATSLNTNRPAFIRIEPGGDNAKIENNTFVINSGNTHSIVHTNASNTRIDKNKIFERSIANIDSLKDDKGWNLAIGIIVTVVGTLIAAYLLKVYS